MKKIVIIVIALCLISSSGQAKAQSTNIKGKNWDIRLSGKSFYDDNVILSPRNPVNKPPGLSSDESSLAFDFSGMGRYKFKVSDALSFAADYSLNHTAYTSLDQYDMQTHTFGGDATYIIPDTGNKIWRLNLRYFYMYNIIDNDSYNGVHYISPSMMFMINRKFGITRINYTFTNEDNKQNIFRDTDSNSIGIDHYYFIFGNLKRRIRVGYAYSDDNASRAFNDLKSHIFKIELKTPLVSEIFLNAGYRYGNENYDIRPVLIGTGIRDDDNHNFMVEFSKVLLKKAGLLDKLTGIIKYQHTKADSTDKLYEHDKNVFSLILEGRF